MTNSILFEEKNNTGIIILNRPEVLNAMNRDLIMGLYETFQEIEKENDSRVIIITGEGRGFCSGADLIDIKNLNKKNSITTYHEKINNLLDIIRNLKLPLISVIRLYCFGAGFIIATHSDFLLASNDAIFCIPASKLKIKIPNEQILSLIHI